MPGLTRAAPEPSPDSSWPTPYTPYPGGVSTLSLSDVRRSS